MVGWETDPSLAEQSPVMRDFAKIWQAADKIVYSRTLESVFTARTRIERDFDPDAVRELKAVAGRDLTVGGPALAAHAFRAGLVDECHVLIAPILVGGGKRSLPEDVRLKLELLAAAVPATGWSTSATAPCLAAGAQQRDARVIRVCCAVPVRDLGQRALTRKAQAL